MQCAQLCSLRYTTSRSLCSSPTECKLCALCYHLSLCRYVRTIIGDPRTLCFGPAEVDGTGNAARLCVVWGVTVTPAGSTLYFTE
jgi:hypothetical protein